MADEWREKTLDDIAEFRNGKAIPPERYSALGRHPVFGSNGQIARTDDMLNSEPIIVIGRVGAYCGSVYYISEASWVTDNAIVALPKSGNDLRFLFYLFSSLELRRTAIGSAQPLMTQGGLKVVRTKVPRLAEQQAIAGVLGALDDKIESNRRTSRALERMARAIFRAWFVDFDPVKAKVAGERSYPGMPQETFDTFPSCLVESELGPIPEGWGVGRIGDVVEMRMARINPSEETALLPYVPIECISPKSLSLQDWKQGSEAQSSLQRFYRGDILFGAMRPYFHKVCLAPFDGTTRTTAFVLVPRKATHYSYAALLIHNPSTIDYATQHSVGSTIPYVKWERSLSDMPVVIPPASYLEAFEEIVRPMLEPFLQNPFENAQLRALRDYLLPKLLSGVVRVVDAGDRLGEGPTQ